jgi:hypothetical protein
MPDAIEEVEITGNTLPVKTKLRKMGCHWDGTSWRAPVDIAARAQRLVDNHGKGLPEL